MRWLPPCRSVPKPRRRSRIAVGRPACLWLDPVPEAHWEHTFSIKLMRQIMGGRMYPLTLDGLDRAMRELVR